MRRPRAPPRHSLTYANAAGPDRSRWPTRSGPACGMAAHGEPHARGKIPGSAICGCRRCHSPTAMECRQALPPECRWRCDERRERRRRAPGGIRGKPEQSGQPVMASPAAAHRPVDIQPANDAVGAVKQRFRMGRRLCYQNDIEAAWQMVDSRLAPDPIANPDKRLHDQKPFAGGIRVW